MRRSRASSWPASSASRPRRSCTTTWARRLTRAQDLGANHLLFCETAAWAAARGYDRFHLGGGVGGFEDSLYEFKRRFDPGGALPAYLGKVVHDPDAYRRLSGVDEIDYAGYFPAYRRPA